MDHQLLKKIPLFESIIDDDLRSLAQRFVVRKHPKNSIIINEGDETNSLYIILNGKVRVFLSDENGKEVILNVQGDGEYFGEISLFDDGKRSASVLTLEPSKFAVLDKQEFISCLSTNPEMALTIIKGLTHRLRALSENVRNLALMDVYGRVAHTLLELAVNIDGERVITEKLTQAELASRVGASTKMVSRIMKDLTTGGYISKKGQHLLINKELPPSW